MEIASGDDGKISLIIDLSLSKSLSLLLPVKGPGPFCRGVGTLDDILTQYCYH